MTLKELQAALKAADAKCDGAIKAMDEAKAKLADAKDEERAAIEADLVTFTGAYDVAEKEASDLMSQVEQKSAEAKTRGGPAAPGARPMGQPHRPAPTQPKPPSGGLW